MKDPEPHTAEFAQLVFTQLLFHLATDDQMERAAKDKSQFPIDTEFTLYLRNHVPPEEYIKLDYHGKTHKARELARKTGKSVIL